MATWASAMHAWPRTRPTAYLPPAGGGDGDVVILDVRTGQPVLPSVTARQAGIFWVSFSPDGSQLATVSSDGVGYVWDPGPERAIEFACRAVGRDLTEAEWHNDFGDEPCRPTCP
jgi:WD40 repeat protein